MYTNHIVYYSISCPEYDGDDYEVAETYVSEIWRVVKERNPAKLTHIPSKVIFICFYSFQANKKLPIGNISENKICNYRLSNKSKTIFIGQRFDRSEVLHNHSILKYHPEFNDMRNWLRHKRTVVGVVKHLYYDYNYDDYSCPFSIAEILEGDEVILHIGELKKLNKIM